MQRQGYFVTENVCYTVNLSVYLWLYVNNNKTVNQAQLIVSMCGFCDSLELGVLRHAFTMEGMISLLQLHVPSWCNLRQLVVALNYIKGPQSTFKLCCENFYHCKSIITLTHESFFFTTSWGGEVLLGEYCALIHKN